MKFLASCLLIDHKQIKQKLMTPDQTPMEGSEERLPTADTGNASNPSPHNKEMEPANHDQLLDDKAGKYIREAGNIEDVPDPQEQEDMDETISRGKEKGN
jgi:hypothetical protein